MKVLIAKIPAEGLDIDFSKSTEWMAGELDKNDELAEYISSGIKCKCRLEVMKDQVFINGEASTVLKPVCYRCGNSFEKNFAVNLSITCVPDKRKKALRGQDYMDGDIGMNYYAGHEIDVAKIAREQLLLSIPMTFLCDPECKGLCNSCGINLNEKECKCDEKSINDLRS